MHACFNNIIYTPVFIFLFMGFEVHVKILATWAPSLGKLKQLTFVITILLTGKVEKFILQLYW